MSGIKTYKTALSEAEGRLILAFILIVGVLILLGFGKLEPEEATALLTAGVAVIATVFKKEATPVG